MPANRRLKWIGFAAATGATIIWSGNIIVARAMNQVIEPATLSAFRWAIACLALIPFAWRGLIAERNILKKNFGYLSAASFLGVTLFNSLLYMAAHTTSAVNISLIAISSPIFIVILARVFLKEHITLSKAGGMCLAVLGVLILASEAEPAVILNASFAAGDAWMLFASLIFAGYSVLVGKKPSELGSCTFLLSTFLLGLLMLLPWTLAEIILKGLPEFSMKVVGSLLYIGLGAALVAYALWNKAIETVGPSASGLIYYTLPLFSGLAAFVILDEPLGLIHVFSGFLIVGGIMIAAGINSSSRTA